MLNVRFHQEVTVDAKGRVALPSALRRALEDRGVCKLVVTFTQGRLRAWDLPTFMSDVEQPIAALDPFDPNVNDFADGLLAFATDVDVDGQGRILLPKKLRELAGIETAIIANSMLRYVDLWEPARWEKRASEAIARVAEQRGMPAKREIA